MLSVSSNKIYTFIQNRKASLSSYHSTQPLPVYLGLIVDNKTRDHSLIEKLSKLGLCISEQRLSQLSILIGNIVIEANKRDGMVFPMKLS